MVEGLPGPQSKRAASASLMQRLQQLSCSAAADPAAEQTPQRFQLLGTLPSGLHETLAARTLQALMASRCGMHYFQGKWRVPWTRRLTWTKHPL